MKHTYKRGDIFYADFGKGIGSEQKGYRPVVIIQNNIGYKHSSTVIVAAVSTRKETRAKVISALSTALRPPRPYFWNRSAPCPRNACLAMSVGWMRSSWPKLTNLCVIIQVSMADGDMLQHQKEVMHNGCRTSARITRLLSYRSQLYGRERKQTNAL